MFDVIGEEVFSWRKVCVDGVIFWVFFMLFGIIMWIWFLCWWGIVIFVIFVVGFFCRDLLVIINFLGFIFV